EKVDRALPRASRQCHHHSGGEQADHRSCVQRPAHQAPHGSGHALDIVSLSTLLRPFSATLGRIMSILSLARRLAAVAIFAATVPSSLRAQASVNETRDPNQKQDPEFVSFYKMWTHHGSPLVDHLPVVPGVPTPKQLLGYYVGAPAKLTYYDKIIA